MNKINKLTLPTTILVASLILGGFYYASQINKQKSIEKQQQIELQAKASQEAERLEQEKAEAAKRLEQEKAEAEQVKKEYVADRKKDCLAIYETESDKWTNVLGWRYSEIDDECFIRYRDPNPKSDAKCDEDYPTGGDYGFIFIRENSLCKEGEFENSF
jgi:uncharacterized protein HemX